VVIAYGDAPGTSGTIDEGKLGLVVTESFDSGTSWTQKFATPVTSGGIKSSIPSVAIAADGMIAMLYLTYDPSTNELSQQLLTTNDDFATSATITLATEKNDAAPFDIDPYLGDFYDLTCVGNTFFGIFSAANKDNGTDASFPTVTFQRAFTGTAGSAGFQLLTSSNGGSPVSASVDPFFFSFTAAVTVSSGTTIVSSPTNESYIVVDSGTLEVASGGTALQEIIISSGGSVLVDAGGTVLDTVISNGGMLQVSSGGVADPTTIFSGGSEIVSGGGTDLGALISGGVQDVFGLASGATVFGGGLELVESGATASANHGFERRRAGSAQRRQRHRRLGQGRRYAPLALGSGTSLTRVTGLRIVDVIPLSNSAETFDNSEPSIAVDPLNKNQLVAGAFGVFTSGPTVDNSPFFISVDGGTAWSPYGELDHNDKSLAWSTDGSTLFAATMVQLTSTTSEINTYSGTISGSDFGSPIDTYDPSHDLDQPWIATGSGGHVFISYNDFSLNPNAHVLVSSDGGVDYTPEALDRLSGSIIQDAPAVRLAVNGATVYGAFTRWNSVLDFDANQTRYKADLYVVRSDDAGADGFDALGSGGLGVNVASPTGWYEPATSR
jgi:autotransporter passenger strand-loop-strand repeat protein